MSGWANRSMIRQMSQKQVEVMKRAEKTSLKIGLKGCQFFTF